MEHKASPVSATRWRTSHRDGQRGASSFTSLAKRQVRVWVYVGTLTQVTKTNRENNMPH